MQNMGSAFFVEIGNIRKEIGDDLEFSKWCFDVLHIPLGAINRIADILDKTDAIRTKQELASARAVVILRGWLSVNVSRRKRLLLLLRKHRRPRNVKRGRKAHAHYCRGC
jgi:hypothetical protein